MQDIDAKKVTVEENVRVLVRHRKDAPLCSTFYYGPTNSGKTYHALENLCAEYELDSDGIYVYAGPLRMLALEVYEKLVLRYGIDNVGLVTGEEQINPGARLLSTTTEMAPREGMSVVLDESHWIGDDKRGNSWTQILVTGRYEKFHIVAAQEAGFILEALLKDSKQITTNVYQRKTSISYKGNIQLADIPPKTAVVCFTKKKVYEVAGLLEKKGYKAGVLYGSLPPSIRKQQIQLFIDGAYDIIVTTDVIGHGINLPIDNVVFVQTEKFDGFIKRPLKRWELAQIAGRAGRFGLSTEGLVYTMKLPGSIIDTRLVTEGVLCAGGQLDTDLGLEEAMLKPQFSDLGLDNSPIWLSHALEVWSGKATGLVDYIRPSSLSDINGNIAHIADSLKYYVNPWELPGSVTYVDGKPYIDARQRSYDWELPLQDLWVLVNGPYDASLGVLDVIASWLVNHKNALLTAFFRAIEQTAKSNDIDILEISVHQLTELKMAGVMFAVDGRLGDLKVSKFASLEEKITLKIGKILIRSSLEKATKELATIENSQVDMPVAKKEIAT